MRHHPETEHELAMQAEMIALTDSITRLTGMKRAAISRAVGYGKTKISEVCTGSGTCSAELLAKTRELERRCREDRGQSSGNLAAQYQELLARYDSLMEEHRQLMESYRKLAEKLAGL